MSTATILTLAIVAFTLGACEPDEAGKRWREYLAERTLAKVCKDGTKIWRWREQLYVFDVKQFPDAKVSARIEDVCQ